MSRYGMILKFFMYLFVVSVTIGCSEKHHATAVNPPPSEANGTWYALGGGLDNTPECLAEWNDLILAGGRNVLGGQELAFWNAHEWIPLAAPLTPSALVSYHGELLASQWWMDPSEHPHVAQALASWDGNEWTTRLTRWASGFNAIGIHDDSLYVGGVELYRQRGATWERIGVCGPMFDWQVHAFQSYAGRLMAGGWLDMLGDDPLQQCVVAWNGTRWEALGNGPGMFSVRALTVYRDNLIAGGLANGYGGYAVNTLARWDGAAWHPYGTASSASDRQAEALALGVCDGKLFVGGVFDSIDGVPAENLACWDGAAWSSVGGGTSDRVTALYVHGDDLVVAGDFLEAGGMPARHVARWRQER